MRRSSARRRGTSTGSCSSERDGVDVRRAGPGGARADRCSLLCASSRWIRYSARSAAVLGRHGVERVEPLLRLARVGVGQLVDEASSMLMASMRAWLPDGYAPPAGCRSHERSRAGGPHWAPWVVTSALRVYTDGACSGNPGPGGWAWAVAGRSLRQRRRPGHDQQPDGDHRRAPRPSRPTPGPLTVVSDSTYVEELLPERWWDSWIRNGWMTKAKKPVDQPRPLGAADRRPGRAAATSSRSSGSRATPATP